MKKRLMVLAAFAAFLGCVPRNSDDGFRAQKPMGAVPTDSSRLAADTARTIAAANQSPYGFSVELKGAAELHFNDEEGRHTGPATAEEYLPVLEAALRNPALHEQERAGLERMREQIKRSGSAAAMATTRNVPNLDYQAKGGESRASYRGADALDMRIVPREYAIYELRITLWEKDRARTAAYKFSAGPGQEGGMDISAMMDELSLSWDGDGDGEPEKEIAPASSESARRVK